MQEGLFQLIMEHDPNLVFVKDEASVIIYANAAFLAIYPPERRGSVIGSTTIEHFNEAEAALWMAEDRRAMSVGRTEIVEEIYDFEGRRRVLLTRKTAFTTPDGEGRLLGISTDITELADREKALVGANDRLAKVSAFAAHDLRSPLASIIGAISIVQQDKQTSLSPKAETVMKLMAESASGLAHHVTSLVQTAGAEHHRDIDTEITDLNLLVEEVRFNLSSLIERTETSLSAARLPSLKVEPNLIRQLLQNLVENAIRHRSSRLPRILIRYAQEHDCDIISVEDNGTGIPPAEIGKVFGQFEQGTSSRSSGGAGLGLALCRRVAALHDGSIEVDASFQDGCRIVLKLPSDRVRETLTTAA